GRAAAAKAASILAATFVRADEAAPSGPRAASERAGLERAMPCAARAAIAWTRTLERLSRSLRRDERSPEGLLVPAEPDRARARLIVHVPHRARARRDLRDRHDALVARIEADEAVGPDARLDDPDPSVAVERHAVGLRALAARQGPFVEGVGGRIVHAEIAAPGIRIPDPP